MKLILIFYAIAIVFKFIFNVFKALFCSIKGAFQKKKEPEIPSYSILNKLGNCSKCGKKDIMKDFEGKKYCGMCYARLYAEKKCVVNQNNTKQE